MDNSKLVNDYINYLTNLSSTEIVPDEKQQLIFHHSAFVQCSLPVAALPEGEVRHEATNGKASLVIKAGELIDPNNAKRWEQRHVPSGSKARLIFAGLNDRAIRTGNPEIYLGKNPSQFMDELNIPLGGKNRTEFIEQLKNVLVCDIKIGVWGDKAAHQHQMKVAKNISVWEDNNFNNNKFWNTTFILSDDYMKTLEKNRVPLNMEALIKLQKHPRAMDVYMFLSYRLYRIKAPTLIKWQDLHEIFGQGIKDLRNFKVHFEKALTAAFSVYPEARFKKTDEGLILHNSPSPVKKSQFFIPQQIKLFTK